MGQDVACAACAEGRTTANKAYRASPFQSGKARLSPGKCDRREQGDGEESPNDFALKLFFTAGAVIITFGGICPIEGRMIQLASSSEAIRALAKDLVWRHGEASVTIAEWQAVASEEAGRREEATRWRIIAGTIVAMIES